MDEVAFQAVRERLRPTSHPHAEQASAASAND
jgi:hypothetical protein